MGVWEFNINMNSCVCCSLRVLEKPPACVLLLLEKPPACVLLWRVVGTTTVFCHASFPGLCHASFLGHLKGGGVHAGGLKLHELKFGLVVDTHI